MDFCLLIEIWEKGIDNNVSKSLISKYNQKHLDHFTDALKTDSKRAVKKQQKQLLIWLAGKLLKKFQNYQEFLHRMAQKKLKLKKKI